MQTRNLARWWHRLQPVIIPMREKSTRERSKASYMISSVAEQYGVHPQTLRLYEREGLLKPSRSDGNTRLYSAKMEAMQGQIEEFVQSLNHELANRPRTGQKEEQNSLIPVIQFVTKRRTFTP
jgi:MerR family transcriptional regulator/heat shock protein HspR